jgi:hypothetical protein
MIRQNYEPIYAANPGIKQTYELISFSFWWTAMQEAVEGFILECDLSKTKRGPRNHGTLGMPRRSQSPMKNSFNGYYWAITNNPRKNSYLLIFVDHFSKYAEIHPIQDQSAATCAKVIASQIVARHGSGLKLVTV